MFGDFKGLEAVAREWIAAYRERTQLDRDRDAMWLSFMENLRNLVIAKALGGDVEPAAKKGKVK
jgi:hypothetical protein